MRKLLVIFAIVLSYTAQPMQSTAKHNIVFTSFQEQEKEYNKLESTQVPADILKTASSRYSGYALNEAYVSEDKEYKLVLSKSGKSLRAYFKSTGEFIKEEA